jgi:hypothetical protein
VLTETQSEADLNKTKQALRSLFPKRSCHYLCTPVVHEADLSNVGTLRADQLSPTFIEQAQQFLGTVYLSTEAKQISGAPVTGPVLGNLLSLITDKLNKKRTLSVCRMFSSALGSEARRIKEQLLMSYFEDLTEVERKFPTDDEEITTAHTEKQASVLSSYDLLLGPMQTRPEVQEERKNMTLRMEDFLRDLKESNFNKSLDQSKQTFQRLFDSLLSTDPADAGKIEHALLQCIEDYHSEASGPCVNLVLVDNLSVIVNYCLQALRKAEVDHCLVADALKAENASLRNQVDAFKEAEAALQELVRTTVDKASKQVQAKDLQIAELTAAINARVNTSENKLRDFSRELQTLQADLDQARREKQLLADTQSEILKKRLEEAETRTLKATSQSSRLAGQLEELRLEHSQIISEKTSVINELSRKIKQLESQTEASPRQDTFILMAVKDYFEGMQSCFASEQTAHKKAKHCMEQLAEVQAELNRTRLAEQSQRFKLTEEFEAKQGELKSQLQSCSKQIAELEKVCQLQGSKLAMLKAVEPPQGEVPEVEVQTAEGKDEDFAHDLLENHLEIQFELIDTQRQSIEALRQEVDSKLELISKLKYDVVAKEDDNDMLLQVVNATLEFTKKMRPSLKNVFGAMHNPELKAKVEQLLTKHRVPFT